MAPRNESGRETGLQTLDFLSVAARSLHQLKIADEDGQEVVEIVRNPSSQLTDRLQTLGLSELRARARELGATFFRDRESVIKPAVQAACLEQEYDRQKLAASRPKRRPA
jgi:hypothetical protein